MDDYGCRLKRMQNENWFEVEEILSNILLRLPVKILLICKSVCKYWRGFIDSPYFIRSHLLRSQQHPTHVRAYDPYYFLRRPRKDFLIKIGEAPDEIDDEGLSSFDARVFLEDIICSFNGLICLSNLKGEASGRLWLDISWEIHVCNPDTGEVLSLPPPHFPDQKRSNETPIHWCFSVFRFVYVTELQGNYDCIVYSSTTGSWKSVGTVPHAHYSSHNHVCINGKAYWLSKTKMDGSLFLVNQVLAVDGEEEKFNWFPNENSDHHSPFSRNHLINLEGCLVVVIEHMTVRELWALQDSKRSTWVKKWSNPIPEIWDRPRYVGVLKNELVFVSKNSYASHDMGTSSWKNIDQLVPDSDEIFYSLPLAYTQPPPLFW